MFCPSLAPSLDLGEVEAERPRLGQAHRNPPVLKPRRDLLTSA